MKNILLVILVLASFVSCKKDDGCRTCKETTYLYVVPCTGCDIDTITGGTIDVIICEEAQLKDRKSEVGSGTKVIKVDCYN